MPFDDGCRVEDGAQITGAITLMDCEADAPVCRVRLEQENDRDAVLHAATDFVQTRARAKVITHLFDRDIRTDGKDGI